MAHFPGGKKLPLLDIAGLTAAGNRLDKVCLTTEESRGLKDIHYACSMMHVFHGMHVGQDRNTDPVPHLDQDFQAIVAPGTPVGRRRCPVGLVEGGFVYVGDAKTIGDLLQFRRNRQRHVLGLDNTGTGNQKERLAAADLEIQQLHSDRNRSGGLTGRPVRQGGIDEIGKHRMPSARRRGEFRMELAGHEPGMIRQFDHLHKAIV